MNVTPLGNPLTVLITVSPLLSDALILMLFSTELTSCVLSLIAVTVGGVVSVTVIVIAGDTFDPLSVEVIDIISFPVKTKPLGTDTEKFPVLSAVPDNVLPSLKFNVIVVLASAVPLIAVS